MGLHPDKYSKGLGWLDGHGQGSLVCSGPTSDWRVTCPHSELPPNDVLVTEPGAALEASVPWAIGCQASGNSKNWTKAEGTARLRNKGQVTQLRYTTELPAMSFC
jgi:hypothetical protein